MAKRKKTERRRKLNGLEAIPKVVSAIVPGDAKQYQVAKDLFRKEMGQKRCGFEAITSLANAAFSAGVAKAAATARGQSGGAEELYNDFIAQRDEYIDICTKKK